MIGLVQWCHHTGCLWGHICRWVDQPGDAQDSSVSVPKINRNMAFPIVHGDPCERVTSHRLRVTALKTCLVDYIESRHLLLHSTHCTWLAGTHTQCTREGRNWCQNTVRRMAHGEQCLRDLQERLQEKGRGPFSLGASCSLDCSWTWFNAFCDKHLFSIYKTCLFLLGIRT